MMVVDSASEGKLTYVPDEEHEEKPAPAKEQEPETDPEAEHQPEDAPKETGHYHTPDSKSLLRDYEMVRHSEFTKVKGMRRRKRNRILIAKS